MTEISDVPEAHIDPTPDAEPGGVDAIVDDLDDFPLVTPDQPRSAQVDDGDLPDSITGPEASDEGSREAGSGGSGSGSGADDSDSGSGAGAEEPS